MSVEEAARTLFALARAPEGLARSLLEDVVAGDARLAWRGRVRRARGTAGPRPAARGGALRRRRPRDDRSPTRDSRRSARSVRSASRHCSPPAPSRRSSTRAFPSRPSSQGSRASRTAISAERRGRPPRSGPSSPLPATGPCIVAHNARFDLAFIDREVELIAGRRLAAPVVDTVALARKLLAGRVPRVGLASLAHFFGTSTQPCHRALPDAQATAEILVALVGLAQERGALTVGDLVELSAPRRRRVYEKRSLVFGAPTRPGVYVFRDRHGQALYVGRARDLRARLRSYFRSERLRPAVEAALAAVERVDWQVLGSELEAALEELRLIRELRPPANARGKRGARGFYLRPRGDQVVVSSQPGPLGPIGSRRRAERAARALASATEEELGRPPLRGATATAPGAPEGSLGLPPLRGRGSAARPNPCARAGDPGAGSARTPPGARGVPARAGFCGGIHAGGLRRGRPRCGHEGASARGRSRARDPRRPCRRTSCRALPRPRGCRGAPAARNLHPPASAGAPGGPARRARDPGGHA